MPSDLALKAMNTVHRAAHLISFNRLGWEVSGMPVLELTTVGRKTGQARSCLLTSPLVEGTTYVVVASRGGDDVHPAWFLNLCQHPDVQVSLHGGPRQPWRARVATSEERARLWPLIVAEHANYAGYQRKTEREIPLVLLDPVTT